MSELLPSLRKRCRDLNDPSVPSRLKQVPARPGISQGSPGFSCAQLGWRAWLGRSVVRAIPGRRPEEAKLVDSKPDRV